MVLDLAQLCDLLQVAVPAAASARTPLRLSGVNTLQLAGETDLCFAQTLAQVDEVSASRAGAVIVPEGFPPLGGIVLVPVLDPRSAFFRVAQLFAPASGMQGIHPSAVIEPGATLGREVTVGACAVIASGCVIGDRCSIGPGSCLGPGVVLGTDCVIGANATLLRDSALGDRCIIQSGTVIGGDGFGYAWDGTRHRKIPQLGRVVIEDDVEIGCNCCVDRATLGETRIRAGAKIDNLVQVAHNTDIGRHVILVSQAGVAGSSSIGDGAVIAGQVAISDHIRVGAGARIGGQSGVTKDVPAGASLFGTPARPLKDGLRALAALGQLPGLLKKLDRQAKDLAALRERFETLERDQLP